MSSHSIYGAIFHQRHLCRNRRYDDAATMTQLRIGDINRLDGTSNCKNERRACMYYGCKACTRLCESRNLELVRKIISIIILSNARVALLRLWLCWLTLYCSFSVYLCPFYVYHSWRSGDLMCAACMMLAAAIILVYIISRWKIYIRSFPPPLFPI